MVTEIKIKKEKPLEKIVQSKCKKRMEERGFSVDVITSGLYGGNGISDIIACKYGMYVAIEVKRFPGMKPSKIQQSWLEHKRKFGAVAECVGSVEELDIVLDKFEHECIIDGVTEALLETVV